MPDKQRVGRFLRALLGLFTVAWVVVAAVSPPDPFSFLLGLVPAWVVATGVAAWLVYGGGYRRLRGSRLYAPGAPTSTATGVFVLLAVALKVALTFVANVLLGAPRVGYAEGAVAGVLALMLAYLAVFVSGAVGRVWAAES